MRCVVCSKLFFILVRFLDKLCLMGVKDLWKVLFFVVKKLVFVKFLVGKILVVDLSGWIVEFRIN